MPAYRNQAVCLLWQWNTTPAARSCSCRAERRGDLFDPAPRTVEVAIEDLNMTNHFACEVFYWSDVASDAPGKLNECHRLIRRNEAERPCGVRRIEWRRGCPSTPVNDRCVRGTVRAMSRSEDELAKTARVRSEDELARTATAMPLPGAAPAAPAASAATSRATLGRFRIERELGAGGMGVVLAAFDPELERRVAVKVLHARSADARARLLREARAMAKLSHPNVITVFDVGSTDGEDFVAMELIDGETLKDWIARVRPRWREIVAAYVAAGRGLAAAHAVGLVHRDFKPSNVLRSHAAKIVVTDFGLSRATTDEPEMTAGGSTLDPGPTTKTVTGAVLGTPAYMAPEQWVGGTVGPASDQFAFCVALWEALAGTRPYTGDTLDELKAGAMRGPDGIGGDAIPRSLRGILRRGLAKAPDARWPSMDRLLSALERALARRRRAIGFAAALAVGGIGSAALVLARPGAAPDCSPPAIDPDTAWSAPRADAIARRDPESAKLLADDLASWRRGRVRACQAPTPVRSPQLACLDGVMARLDLAGRLAETGVPGAEGTSSLLVDPELCARTPPPRLTAQIEPELATALDELRTTRNGGKLAAGRMPQSPCARAVALRARLATTDVSAMEIPELAARMQDLKDSTALVDRCGDDVLKAIVLLGLANASPPEIARAGEAVAAVPQDDLLAEVNLARGRQAADTDRAAGLAELDQAIQRFGKRHRPRGQRRAVVTILDLLISRGTTADLTRVGQLAATWRAGAIPDDVKALDFRVAQARWRLGDVARADALAASLGHVPNTHVGLQPSPKLDINGTVVDAAGHPVAGAEVVASTVLDADAAMAAAPLELVSSVRTIADQDGKFAVAGARGLVAASTGSQRSAFAPAGPSMHLVVQPTVHVDGKVDVGSLEPAQLRVTISSEDKSWDAIAPVRADGSFSIDGVLHGKAWIAARPYGLNSGDEPTHIDVTGDVHGLALVAQVPRPLHIIARSATMSQPDAAIVMVFAGPLPRPHMTLEVIGKLDKKVIGQVEARLPRGLALPDNVRAKLEPDDLFATLASRPNGKLFACSFGVTNEMFTVVKTAEAMRKAFVNVELGCAEASSADQVIVIEVPPVRKLRLP
jgi:hypothetical protein